MAYDEGLAERVRAMMRQHPGYEEKKMFGGIGILMQGNMACGVHGTDLIIRVGPERYKESLAANHTKEFDLTGRPMTGWIVVLPEGYTSDDSLETWVNRGVEYALSLPPK